MQICSADYSAEQIAAWTSNKRPEHYLSQINNSQSVCLVAESIDSVVGFCLAVDGEMTALYVDPALVMRGIGRALLEKMETELASNGKDVLRLKSTLTARGFYRKLGYIELGEVTHVLCSGLNLPCVVMCKKIT